MKDGDQALRDGRRYCSRCVPGFFRRMNRSSWLERNVLTWLGLFPWECVSCRRKRFFRDQGHKAETAAMPLSH